jgi:putative ABC transport system permease protein
LSVDVITCALRELHQNWRRTLAAVSGYAITVAFIIVLAAVLLYSRAVQDIVIGGTGTYFVTWLPACGDISSLTEEELANLAKGIIPAKCQEQCENCTGCNKKPYDILNEGFVVNTNTTRLLTIELAEKVAALDSLKNVSPCLMFRFRDPANNLIFSVAGVNPQDYAVERNCVAAGDLVEGSYLDAARPGRIVVESGFAINNGLKPGMKFAVAEEEFEIAGLVKTGVRPLNPDIMMLFADAERVINKRIHNPLEKEANIILAVSHDATHHIRAMEDVKKLLKTDSLLTTGCYWPASEALGLSERMVWGFMLIVMCGSVLFAAKIQWSAVVERYRSIAILRAIGWSNRVIAWQLVCESLFQSVVGSLIGALAGAGLIVTLPVNSLLGVDAAMTGVLNPALSAVVIVFAVLAGLLAALLPALRMNSRMPLDDLRRF